MKEYIIDRSKWRCGEESSYAKGEGIVALLNPKGYMCCLGQVCEQEGVEDSAIMGLAEPEELLLEVVPLNKWYDDYNHEENFTVNTELSCDAMEINDNESYTLPEREKKLKELFKSHNIKLKFIGKSVPFKN